jgi:tyrosinase
MNFNRRDIIALAASFGVSETVLPRIALAQNGPVRLRQDIRSFVRDPKKVAALSAGVGMMKRRSAASRDDPRGWNYWASSHGTPNAPPPALQNIYGQCKHSLNGRFAPHFLSWHRAFLFYFEETLKQGAADAGQTTAFELPYWDWYTDPVMPAIFTRGSAQTNPLWHPRARTDLRGARLSKGAFGDNDLLLNHGMDQSFSFQFEIDPHGAVHDLVGDDMGVITTSAQDPIFWLHHANIDRLWTAWLKGGRRNLPAETSRWAQQVFAYDVSQKMKQQVWPMLDTQRSLNYRYQNETMPIPAQIAVAQEEIAGPVETAVKTIEAPAEPLDAQQIRKLFVAPPPKAPAQEGLAQPHAAATPPGAIKLSGTKQGFTLGQSPLQVDLGLARPVAEQIQSLTAGSAQDIKSADLMLEDVEILPAGQHGGFSFSIVASLPDGSGQTRRAVIGGLGTFTLSLEAHAGGKTGGKQTLRFPLTDVLNALGLKSPADLERGLRITFEPVHPAESVNEPEFVKVGAVKIVGGAVAPPPRSEE